MISSGITLGDNVSKAMFEVRMKSVRYAIFTISDDGKKIEVTETGARETTYDEFLQKLNVNDSCYIAFDFECNDGSLISKLLLIQWIPDTAKPRTKMLYSSSIEAFSPLSDGFMRVQVNDAAELEKSEMIQYIKSHSSMKY